MGTDQCQTKDSSSIKSNNRHTAQSAQMAHWLHVCRQRWFQVWLAWTQPAGHGNASCCGFGTCKPKNYNSSTSFSRFAQAVDPRSSQVRLEQGAVRDAD